MASLAPQWSGTWAGGRKRLTQGGREVFVIERRVGGVRKVIALDVETEGEAEAELRLFLRDPLGYKTRKQQHRERAAGLGPEARLDAETLAEFLKHANDQVDRGELSAGYVRHTLAPYLGAWATALGGRDLRKTTLGDLKAALRTWKGEEGRIVAEHKRIVALKAFTAWLRDEGRLTRATDPTLDLKLPEVKSPRPVEDRAFPAEQIEEFYALLFDYSFAPGWGEDAPEGAPRQAVGLQAVRDVFVLRAKCGMHGTEIARLARGEGKIRVLKGQGEIAAVLRFPHKKGGEHVVSIDKQALQAARRLQDVGEAPNRVTTSRAVARVVAKHPKFEGFTFEALRHSFVTLATRGRLVHPSGGEGIPLEAISELVGHTSTRTTRRHYLGLRIPPMAVLPLRLRNTDDPDPVET